MPPGVCVVTHMFLGSMWLCRVAWQLTRFEFVFKFRRKSLAVLFGRGRQTICTHQRQVVTGLTGSQFANTQALSGCLATLAVSGKVTTLE